MIRSCLCVILKHEHDGIVPERRVSQSFDYSAERQIVIRHTGARCWQSWPSTGRMIAGQMHNLKLRHFSARYEASEFRKPNVSPFLIANVHIEWWIVNADVGP